MKNRILSLLLAVCMITALLPATLFAGAEGTGTDGYKFVYSFNTDGSSNIRLDTVTDYNGAYNTYSMWKWSDQSGDALPVAETATWTTFGTQIGVGKYDENANQWLALEIDIPRPGDYEVSFVRGMSNSGGGYGDVYLFRAEGTEITKELLASSTPLNDAPISYYIRPTSKVKADPMSLRDFTVEDGQEGKYLLVFNPTGNGNGRDEVPGNSDDLNRMYIHSLTLTAGDALEVMNVNPAASAVELEKGRFKYITASVALSDSTFAGDDDCEITYESSDTGVVTVDEYGMLTGVSSGTATVTITATRGDSSKSAPVEVTVTELGESFIPVLNRVTVAVEDGHAKVTGAEMTDGNDADLTNAEISYEVEDLTAAGIDEVTGEIIPSPNVTGEATAVKVRATVKLDGVSVTSDWADGTVSAGKAASGKKATYNFAQIDQTGWASANRNGNTTHDGHSYVTTGQDIWFITNQYTNDDWEWGYTSHRGLSNAADSSWAANGAVLINQQPDTIRFILSNKWTALRVYAPADGTYWPTLTSLKSKTDDYGQFDIWIFPESDVPESSGDARLGCVDVNNYITSNPKLGNVNLEDDTLASDTPVNDELPKVYLKEGANLIVFKNVSGTGVTHYIRSLTLDGEPALRTVNLELEKTVYDLGNENEKTGNGKFYARLRDGSVIDADEVSIKYGSDDESIAAFDKGVVTAKSCGTTDVYITVTYKGKSATSRKTVTVKDTGEVGSLVITPNDSKPYCGENVGLSTAFVNSSGGSTTALKNAEVYYTIEGDSGIIGRSGMATDPANFKEDIAMYVTVPEDSDEDTAVTVKAHAFVNGELITGETELVFYKSTEKDAATYYTQARRETARKNIKNYTWAKEEMETAKGYAEEYINGFDSLYSAITGEGIPRSNRVGDFYDNDYTYCRYCGADLGAEYGATRAYYVDVYNKPWKVECRECDRYFPSNDFGKFYELGLNADGTFDRVKALEAHREMLLNKDIDLPDTDPGEDGSDTWYAYYGYGVEGGYLYNESFPELRESNKDPRTEDPVNGNRWGVDDGMGYIPDGRTFIGDDSSNKYTLKERHTYIAYYVHSAWIKVDEAIEWLAKMYVYTDDAAKYGNPAAILLNRVADVYPDFYYKQYFNSNHFFSVSHGGSGFGKIFGSINDCDYVANWILSADALYPLIMDESKNGYITNYLTDKAREYADKYGFEYDETDKLTGQQIWRNFEDNIFRETLVAAKEANLDGNYGQTQKAVAAAALVLDTEPESKSIIDWVYQPGEVLTVSSDVKEQTGGNLSVQFVDVVDRDGMGNEASPNYNISWLLRVNDCAEVLELYGKKENQQDKYDLYQEPKFLKMFTSVIPITLTETHTAQIGDSGSTAGIGIEGDVSLLLSGFYRIKDNKDAAELGNELAEYIYRRNGYSEEDLHYDIFTENPESAEQDIRSFIGDDVSAQKSTMMPGYGFAVLRDGAAYGDENTPSYTNNMRDFWLYFGRYASHGHLDSLNLGIEAFGINMAPDNGTPASKTVNKIRYQWGESTIAHNTVTVNNKAQDFRSTKLVLENPVYLGTPYHFDDSGEVKLMDVESAAYAATDIYRRTVVMVNAGPDVSYGIDFFRVKADGEHIYSFHSQSHEADTNGLTLTEQAGGSYAGADVPYGEDPSGELHIFNLTYPATSWLKNVRRAGSDAIEDTFTVDFKITDYNRVLKDSSGLHLRMTMLNDNFSEVALATGTKVDSPANEKVQPLEYVLVKNTTEDSLFTTVFEPYKNNPYLEGMEEVTIEPATDDESKKLGADDVYRAIKVTRTDKRVDYIVYATNTDVLYTVKDGENEVFKFRGFVGVYSKNEAGKTIYQYVNDGDIIGNAEDENGKSDNTFGPSSYKGMITDFSQGDASLSNFITIKAKEPIADVSSLEGKHIYIDNGDDPSDPDDGAQNAVYRIEGAEDLGDNEVKLDIGSVTTIRKFKDPYDTSLGYVYNIDEGQDAVIPLAYSEDNGPEFGKVSDLTATAGNSVTVDLAQYRTDTNGEGVTYSATSGVDIPRGASIDSVSGKVTWKPDDSQIGEHSFKVTVRDDSGRETAINFIVTVYGGTTGGSSDDDTSGGGGGGGGGGGAPLPDEGETDDGNTDTENGGEEGDESGDNTGTGTEDGNLRFIDLGNHAWAEEAINSLADEGVIKGTTYNTYSPANNIIRADYAILLVRAFKQTSENTENFDDVLSADYFAHELAIARNTGIVNGIGNNMFAPRKNIMRQDMMLMTYRALKALGIELTAGEVEAPDLESVDEYAIEAVKALISNGLVNGKNGYIDPKAYTTRAEVAVLIRRILDYVK